MSGALTLDGTGWFVADGQWLGRLVFQRALGAVYVVAFLSARNQFRALLGSRGLMPIPAYVRRVPFKRAPSLFQWHYSDALFEATCWVGIVLGLASVIGVTGALPLGACLAVYAVLWALYLSIVNVGQTWYSFGWESLLLETGFLAIFLGNGATAPPVLTLWLLRWLLFRLEFGAGLIKIRGDQCWRDLTCLYYHHETQPMPGPLSWWFHHLPQPLHRVEVAANHLTQLVVPFGLFAPQPVSGTCAAIMIVTQLWLVASGNFSWLNWMAIVLALSVLPDGWWAYLLPGSGAHPAWSLPLWFLALVIAVTALVAALSWRPAQNLVSRRQLMNASFDRLHLVNTYGAFGSVTKVRYEVVVEGTLDPPGAERHWQEYEFKGKPGDPRRLPRQFAPYHLRLDWLMWFAALSPAYAEPWFVRMLRKLLEGDRQLRRLLRRDPFDGRPPVAVRARLFRYRFSTWGEWRHTGAWWQRTLVGSYAGPLGRH